VKELEKGAALWEFTTMKTLKADKYQRIRIPGTKPLQVFAYANNGNGTITLTEVKAEAEEPFPRGSLKYLCTPERNRELEQITAGTIMGVPKGFRRAAGDK
jgi:hypothetical protein